MESEFPGAIPEIPVDDVDRAVSYYVQNLGFKLDWVDEEGGGIAGISKGNCRTFLTGRGFRETYGNAGPVVVWLNLNSIEEVNKLFELWRGSQAKIVSPPDSKPWNLHEFTVTDLDGNFLRVFYDFSQDV